MRFKVVLPILMLVLTVLLFKIGELQFRALVQRVKTDTGRGLQEGLPGDVEEPARYVSYILSAPAWAGSVHMPWILGFNERALGIFWNDRDCRYLLFVLVLWYTIGTWLDKRRERRSGDAIMPGAWAKSARFLLVGCGIFVCYSAFEFSQPPWRFELWFVVPVFVWGMGLATFVLGLPWRRKSPA